MGLAMPKPTMIEIMKKVNRVSVGEICCKMAPRGSGYCTTSNTKSLNGQTIRLATMTASTAIVSRVRSSWRCSRSDITPPVSSASGS